MTTAEDWNKILKCRSWEITNNGSCYRLKHRGQIVDTFGSINTERIVLTMLNHERKVGVIEGAGNEKERIRAVLDL